MNDVNELWVNNVTNKKSNTLQWVRGEDKFANSEEEIRLAYENMGKKVAMRVHSLCCATIAPKEEHE